MRYTSHTAETMGMRWPGLPLSPLLDTKRSSRAAGMMSHRALFTPPQTSPMDLDSATSDQSPSIEGPPPPSPRLRPFPSPRNFLSPLSLPPPRLQIPSPSKLPSSPVTPTSVRSCNCSAVSVCSACSCMPSSTTPRSAVTAFISPRSSKPKTLLIKPVSDTDSTPCLSLKEEHATPGRPRRQDLNKKRPPKLHIPFLPATLGFQECADKEACKDINVEGGFYGMACRKGRREILEDTYCALPEINGDPGHAFFGVFDGHGGRKAAEFASEHLGKDIIEAVEKQCQEEDCIESAVRTGYLTTDAAFLQTNASSGASCVTALVKDGVMVVANAGDCRAVVSKAGTAVALTLDHRVGREDERQRIESLGGYVDRFNGVWRLQGSLAISRGIGDTHFKKWVSAEPEIKTLQITHDCEFLILASDGLWDVVSNQEAVDCVRKILIAGDVETKLCSSKPQLSNEQNATMPPSKIVPTPLVACRHLVDLAAGRGCLDDISVMVVNLQHFFKDAIVSWPH
ncbi:hypothetical protein O6H91_16G085000 [Diphasiastrum complanatum]|uniref:Uncharacterized protein n=1 Tax=Diphasiastrum complanatum TaxID=34168 RepID=A0ACC2BE98_DIPCM|nr:hypothetical protein O6H91_16G085000 [Diphasiastrum complanatum]